MKDKIIESRALATAFIINRDFTAEGQSSGIHLTAQSGSSLDLHDFRPYFPGNDIRKINWSIYARSEQLIITEFTQETEPLATILVDNSPSMSLNRAKREMTLQLAHFLYHICRHSGYKTRILFGREQISHEKQLLAQNSVECFNTTEWHQQIPHALTHSRRRHSLIFMISDLMFETDPQKFIRHLAKSSTSLALFQVNSPEEIKPELNGYFELRDIESTQIKKIKIDESARESYMTRFTRLRENYRDECNQTNSGFFHLTSTSSLTRFCRQELLPKQFIIPVN